MDLRELTTMLDWLAETTVVAGLLALAALGASRWRGTSPALRHLLWLVVLLKLVTPPLIAWPWAGWWSLSERASGLASVAKPPGAMAPADREPMLEGPHSVPAVREIARERARGRRVPPRIVAVPPVIDGGRLLAITWLSGSVVIVLVRTGRILRFRRRLRSAEPAPRELVLETERISQRLGVRAPRLVVIPDLGTPLLWCLGRPVMLVPRRLLKTLERDRWPAIILHELAHIKRRDHWVRRLDLLAGLVWWWNPLYWLTRSRLDAEAELACDAWVVSTLPKDRLVYAEVLYDICLSLSSAGSPSPALGVAGAGRFVERRLIMILNGNASCRLSPLALAVACSLLILSLPSWLAVKATAADPTDPRSTTLASPESPPATVMDDDDDDDDEKGEKANGKHEGHKAKKGESRHEEEDEDDDVDELWEKLGKEMEKTFGRGSEFAKTFKELGEDLEKKFGPEFEKTMKELGEELEKKLGPNSKFEKAMKQLGEDLAEKMRSKPERKEAKPHAKERKHEEARDEEHGKAKKHESRERDHGRKESRAKEDKRENRIHEIEKQIKKLHEELKELKGKGEKEDDEDDDDDDDDDDDEA